MKALKRKSPISFFFRILGPVVLLFLLSLPVLAQGPDDFPSEAWSLQDIVNLIGKIRDFFLVAGIIGIVIFIVWSGISYLTARGDPAKLKDVKKRFLWTIVGTIIILATFGIISTIKAFLEKKWL